MRTADGVPDDFQLKSGVRQGCVLSPLLFNCFMDRILREATEMMDGGLYVEYSTSGGLFLSYRDKTTAQTCIQDVLYTDDLTMVAETRRELQHMLNVLDQACSRWGMTISTGKSKILSVGPSHSKAKCWRMWSPSPTWAVSWDRRQRWREK